ncbi:MAG: hypothetical protein MUF38_03460 [Anaerolineae bacterium]|jgi:hypothetical protein|nr:hypothetical protein [Anaerolineae bacterium]
MNDTNTTPENNEESNPRNPFEVFLFHQRRALEETGKALEALLPEGFREHGVNATREFTKGLRVLMDAAVEEVKKASDKMKTEGQDAADDKGDDTSTTGHNKVKVQVE